MTPPDISPRRTLSPLGILLLCICFAQGLRFLGEAETYARYPVWNACQQSSISFEFRTTQSSALLLFTDDNGRYDYLQLALTKETVRLRINFLATESQSVDVEPNTEPLNNNEWHRVEIRRNRLETILFIDGFQKSKVSLGSDSDSSPDRQDLGNFVYLGGVPGRLLDTLQDADQTLEFLGAKFRGEIRNVIYLNCSCVPVRTSMLDGRGVSRQPPEECEIRNPCKDDCPCISLNGSAVCDCAFKRECLKDNLASYYLPMDELLENTVVNPTGLDSLVDGEVRLTQGVKKNALLIDGRSQWLRVSGTDHKKECMGDLARCDKGYYLGMWLQFRGVGYQRGVYLSNGGHSSSNHGVAFYYSKGQLEVVFKMADGREWRAKANDVLEDRWYHVAATWSQDKGLHLYINGEKAGHDPTAAQRRATNENSRYNGFYIGRANDNTGTDRLGQVLVDDFVFKAAYLDEKEVRESGPIFHYSLPLDEISNNRLQGKGLEGRVFGAASQVDGKIGGAVLLSGRREYLDLGDVTETCLSDVDLCDYGVYVSLWVLFNRLDQGRKVLFAAPAVALHQEGNLLIASTKSSRESWETRYQGLQMGIWYFVELSWKPQEGLSLFVNREREGYQPTSTYRPPEPTDVMSMYVGRDGSRNSGYPAATFDELDIFYADRETLKGIDFVERERPTNQHFDMDGITLGRLDHDSMVVTVLGRPRLVSGKVGSAIHMDGMRDALDFGDNSNDCFGNLDHCPHGMLVSLWLRPEKLQEKTYFLSSGHNGLSARYDAKKLQVNAATTTKNWEISTSDFTPDKWHFLEVSFHPERGLRLYEGGRLIAESAVPEQRTVAAHSSYDMNRFYVGRGNVDMNANHYGAGAYDELDVWYADRDYLTSQGFIQRSRPDSVIVHFEESPDPSRVLHPTLDIRLTARPILVPGKIGNALELRGRGQYADLGDQSHTCMGNLARCPQGITISAWMKFRSFEDNMVFLSTGNNGLLLIYRGGYMHVSNGGQSLLTAPRFETDRWYYVELSWHPNYGLRLFVDNELRGESQAHSSTGRGRDGGHFYIGRPNDGDALGVSYTTGNFDIDELEVWNGRREDLLAFGYIEREGLGNETFPMDSAQGDRVNHIKFILLLVNGARLVPGRIGQALQLNGRGQYLDLGPHKDSCLGNLEKCPHGFTLSVWLKPNTLTENTFFLSAPTYDLFYEDDQLKASFNAAGKNWLVSTPRLRAGEWQRVTLAWHEKKGLTMYLDDELVATSEGEDQPVSDQPASERVFVGRNQVDTRLTADMQADELQVWYDYLDQLRATGEYKVEVNPRQITFDNLLQDGFIILRDRRIQIIGEVQRIAGLGSGSTALYFDGRQQYIDFGDNFTCNGNLDTCRQGATFRFALKPDRLVDGMYLLDSFPVKLYYKDGRLHAQMQTATQVWNVDTTDFREGQWSRVELSWHPSEGLVMYVNGRRVDSELYPLQRAPVIHRDRKTVMFRPLNINEGSYAPGSVDNIEFYNAYRNYIPEDSYLSLIRDQPIVTRPPTYVTGRPGIFIGEPWVASTQRPVDDGRRRTTTIIRLDGQGHVRFDFSRLPPEYRTPTPEEDFSFWFVTDRPDGLVWFQEEPRRNLYIAMKDGHLVFVNDKKDGRPEQIFIGRRDGRRFDDYRWHHLRIRKNANRITITVDDTHQEDYVFSENVQFLTSATVWLGGTLNTFEKTNGNIADNFRGGIAEVIYVSTNRVGQRIYRNEVNLITRISDGTSSGGVEIVTIPLIGWNGTVTFPPITHRPTFTPYPTRTPRPPSPPTTPSPPIITRPPPPRTTSVTVISRGVSLNIPEFDLKSGSSLSFNFKTINQNGLILFAGQAGGQYIAVELVDGRLYFVHNFGRQDRRTQFSQRIAADGQNHEVEMRFYDSHVDLRLDDVRERLDLTSGERLPTNLGTLYLTGVRDYRTLPWMIWSRESYLGCLSDLRVNSGIIDFENLVQQLPGRVVRYCQAMPQECFLSRPCQNGECRNSMTDFLCDCSRTGFRGDRCNLDAWTALFNGSVWAKLDFTPTQTSHSDDISLRFRAPRKDGLLFETFARGSNAFIRCSLEGGRVKVETNLGGELRTVYAGENVQDLQWHTLYIQRRGNELEVWVDDEPHSKATLAGSGYFLDIDRIYLGGTDGSTNRYIGYLQNFYLGNLDLLSELRGTDLNVGSYVSLPPLIYQPVTLPDLNSYIQLPPLRVTPSMMLHFMFKTEEPSGILLLSTGRNQHYLVVELADGNLYIQFNTGTERPLRAKSQLKVNDGKWHAVTIQRTSGDQGQFLLTVDGVTSSLTYSVKDDLDLQGPLYIGGAPQELLQRDYIKSGVVSRTGFRGCLASMDLSGQVPELSKFAREQGVTIYDTCLPVISRACTTDSCRNFGTCIESGAGSFTCDCRMTAHTGSVCIDEPIGYRFKNYSRSDGLLIFTLPEQPTTSRDEIAFGVMTKENNALLLRLYSELIRDFIEFRLRDGYIVVEYDTNSASARQTVAQYQQKVNDGKYHIVRFIRTPTNATLYVDNMAGVNSIHTTSHGSFDRMSKIYIGGDYDQDRGTIIEGFNGIIGGLFVNDLLVFPNIRSGINTRIIGDVVVAPRPFNLTSLGTSEIEILPPVTTPLPIITTSGVIVQPPLIPVIPSDIGGGGAGWVPGTGGGLETVVVPGAHGGTAGIVPSSPGVAGGAPAMAAFMAASPALPGSGPRAGAVMGTILGLLALASSMMWAFYRCKPGWCTCLRPPSAAPLAISAPRAGVASASNKGAVIAAGGGVGGAGGAVSNAGGAGGGAGGAGGSSFTNFYMSQSSASAGGAGAGGGGEGYDATLRATGTFSNKGTAIGTPKPVRAHLGSTASGVSTGGYSSSVRETSTHVRSGSESMTDGGPMLTPASIQSYHYEGGGGVGGSSSTADYDLATGVSNYQSNTLTAGGGSLGGGSLGGGGGYSSSTMQSSYNYAVRTVHTVSGQQQIIGYAGASQVGVPPGALGEEVRVDCCLMTNDGRSVVTGSSLGPPQVWDMQSGELLRIMQGETVGSTNLHLACNDRLLVGAINADLEANMSSVPKGVHNYMLQIWDFTTGRALEMADAEVCSALTLMSDNDKVVFARSDKFGGGTNVVVWDLLGNQPIKHMRYDAPVGNNDYVHYLALSQNDRYVIAGFTNSFDSFAEFVVFDMTLTSYTVSDPSVLRLDANPECTALLPRDEAVTGLRNGDLVIWSLRTGQPSRQLLSGSGRHAHAREVKAVARSEDNKYLVSASTDGTLKIWDVETERHINTLNGHSDEVWCCAISPDNEIIVSGSRDRTIRLWRLKSGAEICSFNAGVDIFHITMSRDKSTIVALGDKMGARKLIMLQVVRTKVRRQISS